MNLTIVFVMHCNNFCLKMESEKQIIQSNYFMLSFFYKEKN